MMPRQGYQQIHALFGHRVLAALDFETALIRVKSDSGILLRQQFVDQRCHITGFNGFGYEMRSPLQMECLEPTRGDHGFASHKQNGDGFMLPRIVRQGTVCPMGVDQGQPVIDKGFKGHGIGRDVVQQQQVWRPHFDLLAGIVEVVCEAHLHAVALQEASGLIQGSRCGVDPQEAARVVQVCCHWDPCISGWKRKLRVQIRGLGADHLLECCSGRKERALTAGMFTILATANPFCYTRHVPATYPPGKQRGAQLNGSQDAVTDLCQ